MKKTLLRISKLNKQPVRIQVSSQRLLKKALNRSEKAGQFQFIFPDVPEEQRIQSTLSTTDIVKLFERVT